jgi:hypothetical protein
MSRAIKCGQGRFPMRTLPAVLIFALAPSAAGAAPIYMYDGPWSAALYAGPSTNSFFSRTFQGHFRINGAMVGLAGDARLFHLGKHFSFEGEAQVTQFGGQHAYTTGALGIGLRYTCFPWSLALSTGPSYALNPPRQQFFHGKALLNYVGAEFAYAIPHSAGWDMALRFYHRSGAWGLYSEDADEGSMIGIGIRKRF